MAVNYLQPVTMANPLVGPEPTTLICPSCKASVTTRVDHKATTRTHLVALILCVLLVLGVADTCGAVVAGDTTWQDFVSWLPGPQHLR
ncbi:uncharacterized protein LOC123670244 isoform X2 [Melitaea cinxia]|uniref:uncharacterized protein LOC123670244 isoform X2 n=1 Tax=Melitaea cinxia TaxID=113334 RepID=UPI001E271DAC|nr:uncharacterized protein LOC123670244 isoform X2 [Melitaea cinxia]